MGLECRDEFFFITNTLNATKFLIYQIYVVDDAVKAMDKKKKKKFDAFAAKASVIERLNSGCVLDTPTKVQRYKRLYKVAVFHSGSKDIKEYVAWWGTTLQWSRKLCTPLLQRA